MPIPANDPTDPALRALLILWMCLMALGFIYCVTEIHLSAEIRKRDLELKSLRARVASKRKRK